MLHAVQNIYRVFVVLIYALWTVDLNGVEALPAPECIAAVQRRSG
jgi:hypothetical protein